MKKQLIFLLSVFLLLSVAGCTHETVHNDKTEFDSFGRLRVSEVTSLIDIKQLYDKDPLFIDEELNNTAQSIYNINLSSTSMYTSNSGDYVIRQTKQIANYQSGKSHQILMTFYDFEPQVNITKRVGYFSSNKVAPFDSNMDGVFLESRDNTVYLVVAKNGVKDYIAQENWNIDTMDGKGPTLIDINWSNDQIFSVDFEWLGVGTVRWSLVVDGKSILFHKSNHANIIKEVYMQYPNQPLRWEIRQTGNGSGIFSHVCASVGTEGSFNILGIERTVNTDNVAVQANVVGERYIVAAIKLQEDKQHSTVDVLDISLISITNDNYYWELVLNGNVTGNLLFTYVEDCVCATAVGNGAQTLVGGIKMFSGFSYKQSTFQKQLNTALRLGSTINGTSDIIYLTVTPLSSNMDVHGSLSYRTVI